ncbi:MAG: aminopeptidase [Candidatus Woesearchaeota archaeon]
MSRIFIKHASFDKNMQPSPNKIEQLATKILSESVVLEKGQSILLEFGLQAKPLALILYQKLLKNGCHVHIRIGDDDFLRTYYQHVNDQVNHVSQSEQVLYDTIDAKIVIVATENTSALCDVDPKIISQRRKVLSPHSYKVIEKQWLLCQYPTNAFAQDANMSLSEYVDFVFDAMLAPLDNELMKKLKQRLDQGKQVRIIGENTDLIFSIDKRTAIICNGKHNLPDGEVFIAPDEFSVEGHIYYDIPINFMGRIVEGISLTFEKGKVVHATAHKNQDVLHAALSVDEGASRLGEFGIGTNYSLTKPTKQILFDEKMGGTVHLAIGRAYKEGGGKNESAIHWDMIKSLKKGKLLIDGELIQENGTFKI